MMVHMNGSSIDLPIRVLFVTQMSGSHLGIDKLAIMCFTVLLMTIAAPGISVGPYPTFLVTTLSILGVPPPPSISLLIAAEWIVERARSTSNVIGDCYVAAFVEKLCSANLPKIDVDIQEV
ncbi:excitatory amino acid transporter 3-like [Limulus polyphemus]|uniref:Amino acid transporter n=1 Tax=Limulus polyphemus TaxID=6850 RepID=A0ABM1SD31_LIMPO|nr:excitatory amino acid transporter 3-like [Limulus polyphemus]